MSGMFTDENGYFADPEKAAMHAVIVQGGFSTPKREAARMILDGGIHAERARLWMDRQGLTDDDLEWDHGQRPPARSGRPEDQAPQGYGVRSRWAQPPGEDN